VANPEPSPETRFPAGASGNPAGRPKGSLSLTAILRRKLAEADGDRTVGEAVVDALIGAARGGDHRHIKEIIDRTEGKVPDRIAGPDGGAIPHRIEGLPSLAGLTDADLDTLAALAGKLAGGGPGGVPGGGGGGEGAAGGLEPPAGPADAGA
jgi:hypothetical protein